MLLLRADSPRLHIFQNATAAIFLILHIEREAPQTTITTLQGYNETQYLQIKLKSLIHIGTNLISKNKNVHNTDCSEINSVVPEERVELSHPQGRRILNPLRLPFRHSGSHKTQLMLITVHVNCRFKISYRIVRYN